VAAFARHGYNGVGVREIAGAAGVTAMLVNRYFGSKEQLFAEAVDASFGPRTVVGETASTLASDAAARLVARTATGAEDLDPFLLMLRSAGDPRAAEIIRDGIQRHVRKDLVNLLGGRDAPERAELMLSVIAGLWLMRKVIGTPALAEADPAELAERVSRILEGIAEPDRADAGAA
jgi:AcrR family transcriptional regulator